MSYPSLQIFASSFFSKEAFKFASFRFSDTRIMRRGKRSSVYTQSYNGCVLLHRGILIRRVRDKNTACIDDIMGEGGPIAPISRLLADKDPRSHGEEGCREFAGEHNVFLISSHDVCIRHSANAPDGFARTTRRGRRRNSGGNCTEKTEVSRCERKSTMGRRRCLDVCKERGNGRPPLFGHTRMRIMRWKRRRLKKSWGKMGEGAKTVTGGRGARGWLRF